MKWQLVTRKLTELEPYKLNPRKITEKGLSDLTKSIKKFGLAEPIVINTNNVIIGGHARFFVLQQQGIETCECYTPDRQLTDKEMQELNIRLNKNIAGEFDYDILANDFGLSDLLEWGFEKFELGMFEPASIDEQGRLDEKKKVKCPKCEYEFEPS